MRIFAADITFLEETEVFCRYSAFVSAERAKKAEAFASPLNKARSLGAALLLEYAADAVCAERTEKMVHPLVLEYADGGKPYVKNNPELQFNLSHSGAFAVCSIGSVPNGIDIERRRKFSRGLCHKCFTPDEQHFLESGAASDEELLQHFLLLWTRKESYVKALGTGLTVPLQQFSVISADSRVRAVPSENADSSVKDQTSLLSAASGTAFFCKTYQSIPNLPEYTVSVCSTQNDFPRDIESVDLRAYVEHT